MLTGPIVETGQNSRSEGMKKIKISQLNSNKNNNNPLSPVNMISSSTLPPAVVKGGRKLQDVKFSDQESFSHVDCNNISDIYHIINDSNGLPSSSDDISIRSSKEVVLAKISLTQTSDKLKVVKQRNCIMCIVVLFLSILIGIAGGVATGFVGYRYNMSNQRSTLEVKNRIVLNSSVSVLYESQNSLEEGALMLLFFAESMGTNYSNPIEMRDAYNKSFFILSTLAMKSSARVDAYNIYVPFCSLEVVEALDCHSAMLLRYSCRLLQDESVTCYYSYNTENGVDTYEVLKDSRGAVKSMKWIGSIPLPVENINTTHLTGETSGHYLEPFVSASADGSEYSGVTYRWQVLMGNYVIVCETTSFTKNWFQAFDRSLQKADVSYSMIFNSDGSILAYSYGVGLFFGAIPCRSVNLYNKNNSAYFESICGTDAGGILDSIVGPLLQNSDLMKGYEPLLSDSHSVVVEMNDLVVAAQGFMDIETDKGERKQFFAAYATPIASGLDEQSVLQIIICVIIVVVSICILGGVSLFSINQLQKTLELVSVLAVHIATYDLEKMENVLNYGRRGCNAPFGILGYNLLRKEFTKILLNLKAYRPFLPQALLKNLSNPTRDVLCNSVNGDISQYDMDNLEEKNHSPPYKSQFDNINNPSNINSSVLNSIEVGWPTSRLKQVKGTVIIVQLQGYVLGRSESLTIIDYFLSIVLKHVRGCGGVADQIETDHVIITFNFHVPVIRHQRKACQCAMAIQEECKKSKMKVVIAITSGIHSIGTVGTEEQKARVVAGEGVDLVKRIVTLHRYLGTNILVTQQVAHEAGISSIPVDNIEIYSTYRNKMIQHVLFELVALDHNELSYENTFSKKLFNLILTRQGGEAIRVITQFIKNFSSLDNSPWYIRRLYELCINNQSLIDKGYRRKELLWAPLEGEEFLDRHMNEDRSLLQIHPFTSKSFWIDLAEGSASFGDQGIGGGGAGGGGASKGSYQTDDVERAKERIEFHSHSNRRGVMKSREQGEDALISLFINNDDMSTEGDNATEQGVSSAPDSFPKSILPREIEDIYQQVFYRTDELLGKGQFGKVFLAISASGSFVATKVFPIEDNGAALVREVETLIQLRHEHILTYDTCAIQCGYFFIFTEYMAAGSMRKLIERLGKIPERAVRKYARDILFGLQFLHNMKYVHCDVKPDNVLLSSEGMCKLGDFGAVQLARSVADRAPVMRGTPRYMAPEAVMGDWTPKADIYSLGLTLAHMLLGRHPWSKYVEPDEYFLIRLAGGVGAGAGMRPELPAELGDQELARAIQMCCRPEPAQRPTVEELITMLS